ASGRGKGSAGTIDLEELVAAIAGAHVQARGTLDTAGDAKITAEASARDLRQLAAVGVRGLAGSVDAHARVEKTRSHLHVDVDARGEGLVAASERVGRFDAHVHAHDFIGEAHVTASGVAAAGLKLDTLKLDAVSSQRAMQATLAARGPDRTAIDLVTHG